MDGRGSHPRDTLPDEAALPDEATLPDEAALPALAAALPAVG